MAARGTAGFVRQAYGSVSPHAMYALAYAVEYGLALLPLKARDKVPRIAGGFLNASSHPECIGAWWEAFPQANIGAVPGSIGCVVIDIDGPAGEALARSLGVLDADTVRVITVKGMHVWFRRPHGTRVGNVARQAFDVRGDCGYVLLPPSVHPSGTRYTLQGSFDDIAPAPTALVEWLQEAMHPKPAPTTLARFPKATPEADVTRRVAAYMRTLPALAAGEGINSTMFRLAAFCLHECAQGPAAALTALQVQNERNHDHMTDAQLQTIVANAGKYGKAA